MFDALQTKRRTCLWLEECNYHKQQEALSYAVSLIMLCADCLILLSAVCLILWSAVCLMLLSPVCLILLSAICLILCAGRKHQLRIHCARALSAPILGDARYGMTRNDVQRKVLADLNMFNSQVYRAPVQSDQPDDSADMPVACAKADQTTADMRDDLESFGALSVMPLQLHCQSVCLQKPRARQQAIRVTAEPSLSMQALMRLFKWRTT